MIEHVVDIMRKVTIRFKVSEMTKVKIPHCYTVTGNT